MLRIEKSNRCPKTSNVNRANKLLLDNIYEHFSLLHDRELELSKKECDIFTRDVVKRHKDHFPQSCPISSKNVKSECRWKCYIKGVSITHVILTFLPASIEDLSALTTELDSTVTANDTNDEDEKASSGGSNVSDVPINTPYALCLPVYVYDSPLKLLVNAYVENENGNSSAPEDVYLDYRFKFANFVQTEVNEKYVLS